MISVVETSRRDLTEMEEISENEAKIVNCSSNVAR